MFRLIRWLFLMGVIALLAGFSLTYRLHGQTPAERVCELGHSMPCLQLAVRWGETARQLETRLRKLIDPPTQIAPAHPSPRLPRPTVVVATPARESPPLDRHTPQERQALDRILAQRGSQ